MQPRHAALLALVAALLGAFIYLHEIRGGAEREAAEAKSKRLWPGLEADAVSWLALTTEEGGRAELVRDGAAWRIVAPVEFPASDSAVEAILSSLVSLSREGSVQAGDLAAFGLGDDAPVVAFEADGARTTLVLGRDTPVGSNRYVRLEGASESLGGVDFVPAYALTAFAKSLDDLRDARVLPFETAAIDRARFRWTGGEVVLERRDGVWWLTSPVEVRADAERIDTLLADLAYLRAEGFIDPDEEPDASVFESVLFAAELESAGDKESARVSLVAATPSEATGGRIIVRGRDSHLYEVASERLDEWPRRVAEYRDKTLSRFDVDAARTFEIAFQDGDGSAPVRIQGELAGGAWVTGPEPMASDAAASVVTALAHLEGIDVVAEMLGPAERTALGLDPPRVELQVWGEGDSGASAPVLAHVLLGRSRAGIGVYAAAAGADEILLLEESITDVLPTSHAAFRTGFLEGEGEREAAAPDDGAVPIDDAADGVEPEI